MEISSLPSRVTGHEVVYAGEEELWLNEKCLVNYNHDIVVQLTRYFALRDRILDFGAGLGTMAMICQVRGMTPDCMEINDRLRDVVAHRGFQAYPSLEAIPQKYDGIYSANVLEHIEEDVATLKQLAAALTDDGILTLYIPAFMILYSDFDQNLGHHRRYGKQEIVDKLRCAGFEIKECHYVDCLGFFAWLAAKYLGHKKNLQLGSGLSLKLYDRFIFPISKFLDKLGARFLFGKNLIVVARKL
jgi:hypothetical protein